MRRGERRIRWGLLFLLWTLPGLMQAVQEVTYARANGVQGSDLVPVVLNFLPAWYPWVAFTPLVMALARRFPLARGHLVRSAAVHAVACVGFGLAHMLILGVWRVYFHPEGWGVPPLVTWLRNTLWSLHTQVEVFAYWVVLAVTLALDGARAVHERDVRAARLEGQLANARITALRSQLQPHFLFNTLNAINVMMREDVDAAERMLLKLSSLLRVALEHEGGALIPLSQELDHLRLYLDIEQERFPDRLAVEYAVDPELLAVPVPNMLLQPIVENAVRHGIARRQEGGRIEIRVTRQPDVLRIDVVDDGAGLAADLAPVGLGVGLVNTRARLREVYGERSSLELSPGTPRGTRATIDLPLPEAPDPAALPTNGNAG